MALLHNPSVWIVDTRVSVVSTRHKSGCKSMKVFSGDEGATGQNGVMSKITAAADIVGTICDRTGTALHKVMMQNVKIVPGSKFSLFSFAKRQKAGWKLGGDTAFIWLEKDKQKIQFDIHIETNERAIFAAYIKKKTLPWICLNNSMDMVVLKLLLCVNIPFLLTRSAQCWARLRD